MMDPAVLRRLVEQWRVAVRRDADQVLAEVDQDGGGTYFLRGLRDARRQCADDLESALALSVDRVNSLCTCGVLTGGVRSPSTRCPVHAYEGETDA